MSTQDEYKAMGELVDTCGAQQPAPGVPVTLHANTANSSPRSHAAPACDKQFNEDQLIADIRKLDARGQRTAADMIAGLARLSGKQEVIPQ